MVIAFNRYATGSILLDENADMEEIAKYVTDHAANGDAETYGSDYFEEVSAPITSNAKFRCFGGPFTVSRSDIEIRDGRIQYTATQRCLFFADDAADLDTAITMANVASLADCVENTITIEKSANRWEICAPEEVPASALIACYKDYGHVVKKGIRAAGSKQYFAASMM